MAIIDELVTILGFDADDKEAKKYEKALDGIKGVAITLSAAITAAEVAVAAFISRTAEAVDETGKFAKSFGVPFERLQELEFATQQTGGSIADLRGDIASITKSLASPIPGQFNQGMFLLGINVRDSAGQLKSADQVLMDVADRFQGMTAQQRQILATQAGLSEGTLRLVAAGREEIQKLSAEARALGGVLPEEAAETAAEYVRLLKSVKFSMEGLGKTIAISVLPWMSRTLESFKLWTTENRQFISQGVQAVVEGIGQGFQDVFSFVSRVIDKIKEFIPSIDGVSDRIDAARLIATGFETAIGLIAIAFAPVLIKAAAVVAAITAIGLVIEDIVFFAQGKQSVLGEFLGKFIERFPEAEKAINSIKELISSLAAGIIPIFQTIGDIFSQLWKDAGDEATVTGQIVTTVVNLFLSSITNAIDFVKSVLAGVVAIFQGDLPTAVAAAQSAMTAAWEGMTAPIQAVGDIIEAIIGKISSLIGYAADLKNAFNFDELTQNISDSVSQAAGDLASATDEILTGAGQAIGDATAGIFDDIKNIDLGAMFGLTAEKTPGPGSPSAIPAPVAGGISSVLNSSSKEVNDNRSVSFGDIIIGGQSAMGAIDPAIRRIQSEISMSFQGGAYPALD